MTAQPHDSHPTLLSATPRSLGTLSSINGLGALVRDEDLRVRWCDEAYASLCEMPADDMVGTTLHNIMPGPAARERELILREVIETGEPATLVQFGNDKRLLCRILPIDAESFGYRGVLCLIAEGPLIEQDRTRGDGARLVRTPHLDDLATLTKAELRTLYDIGCGHSNQDTADRQFRSVRTIENHVESIHKKLGTSTRSALVRLATERGVHGFSPEEWDTIVDGAAETRRATGKKKKGAPAPIIAGADAHGADAVPASPRRASMN